MRQADACGPYQRFKALPTLPMATLTAGRGWAPTATRHLGTGDSVGNHTRARTLAGAHHHQHAQAFAPDADVPLAASSTTTRTGALPPAIAHHGCQHADVNPQLKWCPRHQAKAANHEGKGWSSANRFGVSGRPSYHEFLAFSW